MNRCEHLESRGIRIQIGNGIQSSYRPPTGIVIGGGHSETVILGFGHENQSVYYSEDRSWQGQDGEGFLADRFGR